MNRSSTRNPAAGRASQRAATLSVETLRAETLRAETLRAETLRAETLRAGTLRAGARRTGGRPRVPVLGGCGGRAGTSTLVAALHARETGRIDDGGTGRADVLVGRSDEDSLHRLAALADATPTPRPLLALTADAADVLGLPGRMAELRSRFGTAVLIPHVPGWRERPVFAEAAAVLAEPTEHLPVPLRAYAAALRRLVAALSASGVLHRAAPALVIAPRSVALWRGLRPLERTLDPDPLDGATPGADLAGAAGRAG